MTVVNADVVRCVEENVMQHTTVYLEKEWILLQKHTVTI
jgi:hypothetical protein